MTNEQVATMQINEFIINTIQNEKPETTSRLIELVRQKYNLPEEKILGIILRLEDENKIQFDSINSRKPGHLIALKNYIFSKDSIWYWITNSLVIGTATSVFVIPQSDYPIIYVRQVLGVLFVLFLPGLVLMKALYPCSVPISTPSEYIDAVERLAFGFALSIALTAVIGLALNYTPWGITLIPMTLTLFALTLVFAAVAASREYIIANFAKNQPATEVKPKTSQAC
jgi:hypothetical protein